MYCNGKWQWHMPIQQCSSKPRRHNYPILHLYVFPLITRCFLKKKKKTKQIKYEALFFSHKPDLWLTCDYEFIDLLSLYIIKNNRN